MWRAVFFCVFIYKKINILRFRSCVIWPAENGKPMTAVSLAKLQRFLGVKTKRKAQMKVW
jgi:hypothetical protein